MIGISYLTDPVAQSMARRIETMVQDRRYDHVFWEDALFAENGMPVQAKDCPGRSCGGDQYLRAAAGTG